MKMWSYRISVQVKARTRDAALKKVRKLKSRKDIEIGRPQYFGCHNGAPTIRRRPKGMIRPKY